MKQFLERWQPGMLSVLRMVAAVTYILSGTMKIFAFPEGMPPDGVTAVFMSQIWIGGMLEVLCGSLLLLGLCTRVSAFFMSGQMAVAYFQFHAPQAFWPTTNGGIPAMIYCFVWLYIFFAGAGPWSIDAVLLKRKSQS